MIHALVIIGAIANFLGSSVYAWNTFRGVSKPNRMTFLLWSLAPMIATVASLSVGVTWAVVPVFVSGLCPLLILLASFVNKNAYWELGVLDYVCGALSLLALVFWAITRDATVAVVFAILSDGLAGLPTLIKAWKYPETETVWGYLGAGFSSFSGILAAPAWTIVAAAFPVYLFVTCVLISAGILRGRIMARR